MSRIVIISAVLVGLPLIGCDAVPPTSGQSSAAPACTTVATGSHIAGGLSCTTPSPSMSGSDYQAQRAGQQGTTTGVLGGIGGPRS
jgi:hypothetical protein